VPIHVGVIGSGVPDPELDGIAESIGRAIAEAGAVVVCGGLGGVMEAACRGASSAGGVTVGLLPGTEKRAANPWVSTVIPTGLGELRNGLVVRASDVLIAIGGEYGTLSEIALALKAGRPVVGVGTWTLVRPAGGLDTAMVVSEPQAAVELALTMAVAT
jgi:uncharacterized protein (TIGR00725 family)